MNWKSRTSVVLLLTGLAVPCSAQSGTASPSSAVEQEIIEAEKRWNAAIQSQDLPGMGQFLADRYFLAVAVQGRPLQVVPRERWLENLKSYRIHSYNIDDMKVGVYGDVAVVLMLITQNATVGQPPRDRSAQFLITDIWVRQKDGWRVTERHSSRPEQPPQATTAPPR
jgi:ketosteroid isomerase-like protein